MDIPWIQRKVDIKELDVDDIDDMKLLVDQIGIDFTVCHLFNHFNNQNIH